MITVTGEITLKVNFEVEIDMTEEEFDQLSEKEQNELLESAINWYEETKQAEIDDINIYDVVEQ